MIKVQFNRYFMGELNAAAGTGIWTHDLETVQHWTGIQSHGLPWVGTIAQCMTVFSLWIKCTNGIKRVLGRVWTAKKPFQMRWHRLLHFYSSRYDFSGDFHPGDAVHRASTKGPPVGVVQWGQPLCRRPRNDHDMQNGIFSWFSINCEPSSARSRRKVVLFCYGKKIVPQKSKQQLFIWDQYCHLAVMAPDW